MQLMKKICEELDNIEKNFLLTDTQKAILILIKVSETPQQAYEVTSGTESAIQSKNILRNLNMINVYDKKVFLTERGEKALIDYNLIDNLGELTELGTDIIDNYKKNYDSLIKTESSVIKEIIN